MSIVVIPFRDRGIDPLRQANLNRVASHWAGYGFGVYVSSDGRKDDEQFNRSAAYNRAVADLTDGGYRTTKDDESPEVFIFAESDMLIPDVDQIKLAIALAKASPGLVVPFRRYCYLSQEDSELVRNGTDPWSRTPESTMEGGKSIGAINVVSQHSLELIGQWDEKFEGNWYDDNAMQRAFDVCCGPTRWVDGPAYHLYHLPGWKGDHLSDADRAATERNKHRYSLYLTTADPNGIRELTLGIR